MRRLSHKIYLTIVVCLVVVVLFAGAFWRRTSETLPVRQAFEVAGELAAIALAPPEAPADVQRDALRELAGRLSLDLSLFSSDRLPTAAAGRPLPAPPEGRDESGWMYGRGGPTWAIALPDGRWLVARAPRRHHRHPAYGIVLSLGAIALIVALFAYPVVRGLTRRLERLQAGVEKLGQGDLAARVEVQGRDEVARLAQSFNAAAGRIEALVTAHKMLLANASHELRTPLSRIRLGLELIKQKPDPAREVALERDIAELDALIEEVLLASRLDAVGELDVRDEVDLLAVAAEEAARYEDHRVTGTPVLVRGDPRLLRRLVRNLLENAARHGAPPVEVEVAREAGRARLSVRDAGPGIAPAERERIFEPFRRGRAKASAGGSGLGLALVRQIARRHGGDATLAPSAEGCPTTGIVVDLPAA
jgi:signal transduction histidine kinase